MRKVDRLFEILQLLRGQRLRTAEFIAGELGVSLRTVYRDIQGLIASGIPIIGERGVGYLIQEPIELRPMQFTPLELKAIRLGMDMVQATGDGQMAEAAQEVSVKIRDIIRDQGRSTFDTSSMHVYFQTQDQARDTLEILRLAEERKKIVTLNYRDANDVESTRSVRPLALVYWGKIWTLVAYCEKRCDFRMFRIDRIAGVEMSDRTFSLEKGKTYKDYLALVKEKKNA
ncbi:helix-turn-helix transcriptional regulator [Flexibacterium corallicola]|uniref:helix-turn-helix transcriptional regulator n=1 Tax=Flexibacterium corallicola TaxID=3037259 RepID=UPI00286F9617|nr:YafY family protein [Pseudovibrio sp. M1P-2-3]